MGRTRSCATKWPLVAALVVVVSGCEGGDGAFGPPLDPEAAELATVDRFSDLAGLFKRSEDPQLPGPDQPIDFDELFSVTGLGPAGERVQYYTFDSDNGAPMAVYRLVNEDGERLPEQLDVVSAVPGQEGYSDFWQIYEVSVPADYVANAVTSAAEILDAGFETTPTEQTLNRPIVPRGSTAELRFREEDRSLRRAWFDDEVVDAFAFDEHPLKSDRGSVAYSTVYVCTGAAEDGASTASGFCAEDDAETTRNVVETLPGDPGYSPYWLVRAYPPSDFATVMDLETVRNATELESRGLVNCPVVSVE